MIQVLPLKIQVPLELCTPITGNRKDDSSTSIENTGPTANNTSNILKNVFTFSTCSVENGPEWVNDQEKCDMQQLLKLILQEVKAYSRS